MNLLDATWKEVETALRADLPRFAARFVPSAEREDIVQDAIVQVWVKRGQFNPARGSFTSWSRRVLRNLWYDKKKLARMGEVNFASLEGQGMEIGLEAEQRAWAHEYAETSAILTKFDRASFRKFLTKLSPTELKVARLLMQGQERDEVVVTLNQTHAYVRDVIRRIRGKYIEFYCPNDPYHASCSPALERVGGAIDGLCSVDTAPLATAA